MIDAALQALDRMMTWFDRWRRRHEELLHLCYKGKLVAICVRCGKAFE